MLTASSSQWTARSTLFTPFLPWLAPENVGISSETWETLSASPSPEFSTPSTTTPLSTMKIVSTSSSPSHQSASMEAQKLKTPASQHVWRENTKPAWATKFNWSSVKQIHTSISRWSKLARLWSLQKSQKYSIFACLSRTFRETLSPKKSQPLSHQRINITILFLRVQNGRTTTMNN